MIVTFFKNYNTMLSGYATYAGGLLMTDTFNKRQAETTWRSRHGMKGKHGIKFVFID